jgi:hypothetical protein
MKNTNWRIKKIRHKIMPSASFSYTPDFGQKKFGFWGTYVDGNGKINYYNHFEHGVFGSAGMGESGAISLSLNNNLEAKVLEVNDSISSKDEKQKFKNVKLIDINMSTSYNMIADSFKLSPIGISARTAIKGVDVSMGVNLNPYMVNEKGKDIDEYVWSHKSGLNKLGRLTNANMSFGMTFNSKKDKPTAEDDANKKAEAKPSNSDNIEYTAFSMPWSFRFDYSFFYNKTYTLNSTTGIAKPTTIINQSLNMGGSLDLTEKWKMDMNTNFDIQAMKFSFTTVNVSRTMHCWTMSFSFVPFGDRKSYSFNLSASSAILKDLKISKQSSWRDNNN